MTKNDEPRQYQVINNTDQFIQHPKYNNVTAADDIAIIRLNEKIHRNGKLEFIYNLYTMLRKLLPNANNIMKAINFCTAYVQPIYLPSIYSIGNSFKGWNFTILGWGESNKGNFKVYFFHSVSKSCKLQLFLL